MKTKILNKKELFEEIDELIRGGKEITIRHSTTGSGEGKCAIKGIYTITYEGE